MHMPLKAIAFDWGHTLMDERRDEHVPLDARSVHLMPGVAESNLLLPMVQCCSVSLYSLDSLFPFEYALGLPFATLYLRQEGHPRQDLWKRAWQAEAVGQIVIAAWTTFELEPSPLQ